MPCTRPLPNRCPCGASASSAACCGRYLDGGQCPETAEALMRSRYVAYVQGWADYLLQTWHLATRPATLDLESETARWLGLQVRRVERNEKRRSLAKQGISINHF